MYVIAAVFNKDNVSQYRADIVFSVCMYNGKFFRGISFREFRLFHE